MNVNPSDSRAEGESRWPLTIIRRGERVGSSRPDYVWWQELPVGETPEGLRSVGYEVVEVVPRAALLTAHERAQDWEDTARAESDEVERQRSRARAAEQRAEKAERELGQYKMGPEVREIVARAEAAEQRVARWRVLLETSVEDWRSGQLSGAQMCEDIEYALQHGAESVDEAREKL